VQRTSADREGQEEKRDGEQREKRKREWRLLSEKFYK